MGIFLVETPGEEFLRIFHCQLCDFAEGLVNCRTSPGKHQHFIPIKQLTVALKSSPVLGFKKSLLLRSLVTFTKISNLANLCAKNSVAGADYRVRLCLTATQLVTHLKFQIQRYLYIYIYWFWTILTKSIYTTQKKTCVHLRCQITRGKLPCFSHIEFRQAACWYGMAATGSRSRVVRPSLRQVVRSE